eukprot:695624-Pyramimonas_sp.AAC.2
MVRSCAWAGICHVSSALRNRRWGRGRSPCGAARAGIEDTQKSAKPNGDIEDGATGDERRNAAIRCGAPKRGGRDHYRCNEPSMLEAKLQSRQSVYASDGL